jgi:hypothetical protein
MLRKWEDDGASTDSYKGKQVMEVDFVHQSSPMNKSNDKQFSRDLHVIPMKLKKNKHILVIIKV